MTAAALETLDAFPYRHRAGDLMARPAVTIAPDRSLVDAATMMTARRVSSLIVVDEHGKSAGILTEHDILQVAAKGAAHLERRVSEVASHPVHGIDADTLVYRALARMARLGVRHLPVLDDAGRPLGMLTAGTLVRQRAGFGLTLGDEIEHAGDGAELRSAHEKLPALAAALLRKGVPATQVSTVIAAVVCHLTERAGSLALAAMRSGGRGDAPARWCLLVLGSAGRGESLLSADQDNALVHAGDDTSDAWFLEFGQRLNDLLDAAGVPLCKGGVMAGKPAFCRSLAAWRTTIDSWVDHPRPDALLNVDMFYDFVAVSGDRALAGELRRHAADAAARSPLFLRLLADASESSGAAFDLLGRLRTTAGRIDLKWHGLLPLVSAARVIALACGSTVTSTDVRLAEAAPKGALSEDTALELVEARAIVVETLLNQQLADIDAGRPPSNLVEPRRLKRVVARRLKQALKCIAGTPVAMRDVLSRRHPGGGP